MTPREVWLRGPVPDVDAVLQPVAHALLQVAEELPLTLGVLSHEQVWARPGQSASIGYHLAHLTGSLDRLFTYARGEPLGPEQRAALSAERAISETRPELATLLPSLVATVQRAMDQLRSTSPDSFFQVRFVGQARVPSNTLGLLFHAAEHTTRHAGQILTIVRVLATPSPASQPLS